MHTGWKQKIQKKSVDKGQPLWYNKVIKRKGNKTMMNINNMPSYATEYTYIVACECNEEYWFYGAYNDRAQAEQVANDCEGVVFNNLEM